MKPPQFTRFDLGPSSVLLHEQPENTPVIAMRIFYPVGSGLENSHDEGLCHLTSGLITRQTANKDMYEFSRFVENHGLRVKQSVSYDYQYFSLTAINDYKEQLLDLTEEILTEPHFSSEALTRLRKTQLANIRQRRDSAFSYAMDRSRQKFYGDHPYNHYKLGLESSVQQFDSTQCEQFYFDHISQTPAVVSVVGNLDESELRSIFSSPGDSDDYRTDVPSVNQTYKGREIVSKDVDQPTHVLTYEAPTIRDEQYVTTKVLDNLLGSGMSSLLFDEMREKRSLGYQVGTSYPSRRKTSNFSVYLGGDRETNGETFRNVFQEIIEELADNGPTDEQLSKAKESLKGNFLLKHETPGKRAWYRGFYEVLERGAEYDRRYQELIDEVTPNQIIEVCEEIFINQEPLFLTVEPTKSD